MGIENKKEHLPLLDIFRITICIFILLFHAQIHNIWRLAENTFFFYNVKTGAIYMDAFFILSGFLLFYLYGDKFNDFSKSFSNFYIKRLIRIYPQYVANTTCSILYGKFYNLFLILAEVLCIQGFIPQIFSMAGNDGTWFISCLLFSYLMFPFLGYTVNRIKGTVLPLIFLYGLIVFISAFSAEYKLSQLSVYIHPVFRILEFIVGMFVAKIFISERQSCKFSLLYVVVSVIILFLSIPLLYNIKFIGNIPFKNNYVYYTFITIPAFSLIIYNLANIKNTFTEKLNNSKILSTISGLTFPLFIWQSFAVKCTNKYFSETAHPVLYLIALNLIFAVIAYLLFDKLLTKFLREKLNNN